MSNSTRSLSGTATAVEALGGCQADIDLLDDASLQAGMRLIREHEQELQRYKLWLAAAIARRSDHVLGYDGLARRSGFPTPATFIQSMTGSSLDQASKLARIGQSMVAAVDDGGEQTPVATAAVAGGITLDCADAIARGLGTPDLAVTAEQLRLAAERLIAQTQSEVGVAVMTPEAVLKLARQARHELDLEAVERGEKQRQALRYLRRWSRDGMSGGSWALPDEDGGADIDTALRLLLAKTNGGPRFPETDAQGDPITTAAEAHEAELATKETRNPDQILADGFTQIFLNGLRADPTVVPGAGRAAVRVIVEQKVIQERAGSALLEENLSAISVGKLEEYLCAGGSVEVSFGNDGSLNVGREQRLFTARQRIALGVRDGGCRFPGCQKPPSWCEAHHIEQWVRDRGLTNLENGVLLCRYHHMLLHSGGWQILRDDSHDPGGGYWLRPPAQRDPQQRLIEMPTRNPLLKRVKRVQSA